MLSHYVEFLYLYPGTANHITSIGEISERDPKRIRIPDGCTAFRFFDVEGDKQKNSSGWYWLNCERICLADAPQEFWGDLKREDLERYMAEKGIEYIVKTKTGHFIPLRNEDTIL